MLLDQVETAVAMGPSFLGNPNFGRVGLDLVVNAPRMTPM